ncbi:uncharacterized protein LOC141619947 [Silene latifolia]|uniref:uncharacterized protein LOC141619947 n=1 Tax=Silene latifolia TaxID=37657 RepID=UPI003D77ADA2
MIEQRSQVVDTVVVEPRSESTSSAIPSKPTFAGLFTGATSGDKAAPAKTRSVDQFSNASNQGMPLSYVQPKKDMEIEIDESDVIEEVEYWRNTLVGTVMGRQTTLDHMQSLVTKSWNHVVTPEVLYFAKGWFYFRFASEEDCEKIMNDSWNMNGFPLILKNWSTTVVEELHAAPLVPVRVKFPHLDPCLWSSKGLSKVASFVGRPICADEFTTNKSKLAFARILIEVDLSKDLPTSVSFKTPFRGRVEQKIEYEWLPYFCQACRRIGHTKDKCRAGMQSKVYRAKGKTQVTKPSAAETSTVAQSAPVPGNPVQGKADSCD